MATSQEDQSLVEDATPGAVSEKVSNWPLSSG